MTENNSKYKFLRPSRTEQCNRPVTQSSLERWPENWEEKFCNLRNVWSQHTKLREKQLRAGGTKEVNISNKKKEFLDYLLHKKEKEQSSSHKCEKRKENEQSSSHANTEESQHDEEETEDKVDLKKSEEEIEESEEESSSDQVEETEETCEEKTSLRSTKSGPRLRSGSQSKCSKLHSKKVVKKSVDERQYIKDLKHLHNNIETFLHQSSTYLDESCSKKQKIPNPYIKNCYLEGYNGPFLGSYRKSIDPSVSQLGFIKMPDHPVQEQLSGKQLEKLSLYNAPNIEIYGNCGDLNCPFSGDFSKKSKRNQNYSYCDNELNLKLNNFRYEQVCHQTPQLYRCCTCPHHNAENIKQKKRSPKQRTSFEGDSDQSDISIKSQKRCCECKKMLDQSAPKSIKFTKSKESSPPITTSKRSVKSDKFYDDRSSKKSTKSSKSLRGILKECCDVEEKSVKNVSIKSEKSVNSIKPAESVTSTKNDPVPDIKSENSDESVKANKSSTSKMDYKVACDSASKKSSKHRAKTVKECCELDIKSDLSIKLIRLKSNYHLQEKRSISPIKSNKSVKEIGQRSSSGSYESAKQHNESYLGEELVKKKSKNVKNLPKRKKKVIENSSSKCKCEGLKRGENLTPVNPKGIRRKKKHKKQENKVEVDYEDEDSEPEMTFSEAGYFNKRATMFDLVKSPHLMYRDHPDVQAFFQHNSKTYVLKMKNLVKPSSGSSF